jgi:hypothetical protein
MAYVYNQEWSEPLTQHDAVVMQIGLQISDVLSTYLQDGVAFFKPATTVATAGQTSQALFSEALKMSAEGTSLLIGLGLIVSDTLLLNDGGFFYRFAGNPASRLSVGDNENATPSMMQETVVPVLGLLMAFSDNLNYWLDQQSPPIIAEWDIVIVSNETTNWLDQQFDFELTPDQVSKTDLMTMSDAFAYLLSLPLTEALSDTLTLSDALAVGYGDAVNDQMTQVDVNPTITGEYDLVIVSNESGNWADAFSEVFPGGGALTETLADTLTMSDALGIGYGEGTVDQLTLTTALGVGYGLIIADTMSMSDAFLDAFGLTETLSDTLSMSDGLGLGYGEGTVDQLTLSDASGIGYGLLISDTLTLSDGFFIQDRGGSFIFELIFAGTVVVATGTVGTESLSLADALIVGYGDALSDALSLSDAEIITESFQFGLAETLTLSDVSSLGYGLSIAETLSMSDQLGIGYGDLITDTMTMSDAFNEFLNQPNIPEVLVDTLTMSDSLVLGYGDQITDQLTLSDQLVVGYGDLISDQLTLTDTMLLAFGLTETLSDILTLTTALAVGYGNAETDTLTMSDACQSNYGLEITDQLTLSDSLLLGYGDLISDTLTLSDAFAFNSNQPNLQEALSDQLTLSDSLLIGYGEKITDQLVMTDQQPTIVGEYDIAIFSSETANWNDAKFVGYGDQITDQLAMSDAFAYGGQATPINLSFSDQIVLHDQQPTFTYEYDIAIGCPHLDNWQDALKTAFGLLISEQLVMSDALKNNYPPTGFLIDSMTMSDAIAIGYGDAIKDQLTLSDQFGYGVTGPMITELLSDTLTLSDAVGIFVTIPVFADDMTMSDAFAYNLAQSSIINETLADTLTMSDKLRIGYGNRITDQLTLSDALATFLSTSNLPELFADTLVLADQLTDLGYGLQLVQFIGGPVQLALDTFLRPNENPLDATRWTLIPGYGSLQIVSERCEGTDPVDGSAELYTGIAWPNNQYAETYIQASVSGAEFDLLLRTNGDLSEYYDFGFVDNGNGTADVYIIVAAASIPGSGNILFENTALPFSYGDKFTAIIVGGQLIFMQNGTPFLEAYDYTIASGGVALFLLGVTSNADIQVGPFAGGLGVLLTEFVEIGYGLLPVELQLQEILLAQDNFTRPNEDPLNPANWTELAVAVASPLQVVSDRCLPTMTGGSSSGEIFSGASWESDQAVTVTLGASAVGGEFDILLRSGVDLGTDNVFGYDFGFIDNGNGTAQVYIEIALDPAGSTLLWQNEALPFSDGDQFTGVSFGRTQAFYHNGQLLGWANDTTYSSGQVGLFLLAPSAITDIQISDFLAQLPTSVLSDQFQSILGVISLPTDTLTMSEQLRIGYGLELADALTLTDFVSFGAIAIQLSAADQLTLSDAFNILEFPVFQDTLTMSDQLRIGYGDAFTDQLVLSDHIVLALIGATISMFPSDQMVQSDSLLLGYGDSISDQLVLSDGLILGLVLSLSDQAAMSDQLSAGPGLAVNDQMATQADALKFIEGMVLIISEASMTQLDSLAALFAYGLQVNDAILFKEQMTLLYGLIFTGDQMVMSETVTTPSLQNLLELALEDAEYANWLDSVLEIFVYQPTEITLHSLTVFGELVAGLQVSAEVEAASISVESQLQEVTEPLSEWIPSQEGAFVYDASEGTTYGELVAPPGFEGEVASLFSGLSALSYSANHFAECTIASWNPGLSSATSTIGPAARMFFDENGLIYCYAMEVRYDGMYQLVWLQGVAPGEITGPNTQRGLLAPPSVGPGVAIGNVLRIEVNGTQVTGLVNGEILFGPITDTRLLQGNPGLEAYPEDATFTEAIQVSNFVTGTLPNGSDMPVSFAGIGDLVTV